MKDPLLSTPPMESKQIMMSGALRLPKTFPVSFILPASRAAELGWYETSVC